MATWWHCSMGHLHRAWCPITNEHAPWCTCVWCGVWDDDAEEATP